MTRETPAFRIEFEDIDDGFIVSVPASKAVTKRQVDRLVKAISTSKHRYRLKQVVTDAERLS